MRPRAAIADWNPCTFPICSAAAPPLKTTCPVSPSNPRSRAAPPVAICHTMASAFPSVVVTIGDPPPPCAHHALASFGGEVALILIVVRSPLPETHPDPLPRIVTYVLCDV